MTPYYSHAGITIYCADCLSVLPDVSGIDLVFTSPPYNKGLKYNLYVDKRDDFEPWIGDVLKACFNSCIEPTRAYFIISEHMLYWLKASAEAAGWTYGQLLTWCKPNLVGGAGKRITGDWNNLSEWIVLLRKGPRTPMLNDAEGCTFNWFVETCPQSTFGGDKFRQHVAQMPLALVLRILRRTPGRIILDPFMGSGTTLVAAKRLGRSAIGIDMDESACALTVQRLQQEQLALDAKSPVQIHEECELKI